MTTRIIIVGMASLAVLLPAGPARALDSEKSLYFASIEYTPLRSVGAHFATTHCTATQFFQQWPVLPYGSVELSNEAFREAPELVHEQVLRLGRLRAGVCPVTRGPASAKLGGVVDVVRFGFRGRDGLRSVNVATLVGFDLMGTMRLGSLFSATAGYQQLWVVGTGATQGNLDAELFSTLPLGDAVPFEVGIFLAESMLLFDWEGITLRPFLFRAGVAVVF